MVHLAGRTLPAPGGFNNNVLMHHDALVNRLPVYQQAGSFVTLVGGFFLGEEKVEEGKV